jgi:hypothetical protein
MRLDDVLPARPELDFDRAAMDYTYSESHSEEQQLTQGMNKLIDRYYKCNFEIKLRCCFICVDD